MSQNSMRVVARITALPGQEKALEAVLTALVAPTREEPGCLGYQLLRHESDATEFTFVEEWRDNAAIDAHFETPHLKTALQQAAELLACAPDIRRYRVVV